MRTPNTDPEWHTLMDYHLKNVVQSMCTPNTDPVRHTLMDYPLKNVVQSMRTPNTDPEWHTLVDCPSKNVDPRSVTPPYTTHAGRRLRSGGCGRCRRSGREGLASGGLWHGALRECLP